MPELRAHLHAHVAEVCRLLGGGLPGDFGFVRSHAERRAEQKFPLDAVLQGYRLLHKALSDWVRDAALEVADESAHLRRVVAAASDFTIEYAGGIGTLLTSEYVFQTRRLAEADADRRSELLNMLLDGYDETDQAASRLLRRAGYLAQRQSYCVAMALVMSKKFHPSWLLSLPVPVNPPQRLAMAWTLGLQSTLDAQKL